MIDLSTCVLALLLLLALAACQPEQNEPETESHELPPTNSMPSHSVRFLTLEGRLPDDWEAQVPTSNMRLVQYRVPGADSETDAEFIVFYFGPGQGGSPAANIARWQSQFSSDEGPVKPEISALSANGMPVTFVSLSGDYGRSIGMGGDTAIADQTLLAAIVESSHGNLYVQLHGPTGTVMNERGRFLEFVTGMGPVSM